MILLSHLLSYFKICFGLNKSDKGSRNPPNCNILDSLVFDNFILADELYAKALRRLETCVSVNKNLCGRLASSLESPITFDKRFKVTLVPSFILDFNLLSCNVLSFAFKELY